MPSDRQSDQFAVCAPACTERCAGLKGDSPHFYGVTSVMGGVAPKPGCVHLLVKMSDQKHTAMTRNLFGILVAAYWMGAWFAVAQTNTHPSTRPQSSAIRVNSSSVAAVGTGRTNPAIAVSPHSLDFASVAVGESSSLSFTVENVGAAILTGAAKVSAPFRIIGGSPYVLGSSQSQVISVQYVPKVTGMNMTVVRLTGGGGANITVVGSAVRTAPPAPTPPTLPAPPQHLRLVAGP